MDNFKTIGKWVSLFLLVFHAGAWAEITLRMIDESGAPLQEEQAGHPFMIHAVVTNSTVQQAPIIEGLDQFTVRDQGWSYQIMNARTTIKHNYTVIAYEQGTYTIGPATLSQNGSQEQSDTLTISVGEQELKADEDEAGVQAPTLLHLQLDKQRVIKGERIVARLRFYYTDPSQSLRNLVEQESDAFRRKKARGPWHGQEIVNDIPYRYIEFDWDMYPLKTGDLTVPAFGAEYEVERERDNLWGGLGRFFGNRFDVKRIYSNAIALSVDDVPVTDKQLQGVGTFNSFTISAKPSVVKQGEGTVITLAVTGEADPEMVTINELQGIPPELRSYESQQLVDEPKQANEPMTKRYEYIVQGLQTGSWQIPAQQFYYLDTTSRSFKTLTTAPLSVTIMPGALKQLLAKPPGAVDAQTITERLTITDSYWRPEYRFGIMPWWLFLLLVALPFLLWIVKKGRSSMQVRMQQTYRARRAYNAFSLAHAQLKKLQAKEKPKLLYALFVELFANRWQLPISTLSQELIEQRLKDIGLSSDQQERWQQFFKLVTARAFGGESTRERDLNLFNQAELWLQELKQSL